VNKELHWDSEANITANAPDSYTKWIIMYGV